MIHWKVVKRVDPKGFHRKEKTSKKIFFLFFFLVYLYEMIDVSSTCCGNHFTICVNQAIMPHALNVHSEVHQFSSVQSLSRVWLCDPMNRSTPGLPVHHQLPESTQTHVHWVSDTIQPSLLSLSAPALNLSQHQGLFKWVSSSHQMAQVLEFQLQHQSFQWTPRTDLL